MSGIGGTGKTTLAAELATRILAQDASRGQAGRETTVTSHKG